MKITFVTSGTIKSNFTYRVLQLSRSLQKRGHDVSVICPIADKYNNFIPEKIKEIDGVKIIQPFQFKTKRLEINLLPYIFHTAWIILRNKSDLVYIYKPTPVSVVGLLGKLFYKTETVLDMDDFGSEVMKVEKSPIYQIKLVEWCEKLAARYADRIVTVSTYLENYFRSKYNDKPIIIITNAVDSAWFKPLIFSQEKKRIVFLGLINRLNILEPLFDALPDIIKSVPDLKLKIIGDGKFLSYFKKKVQDLSISNYVEFTGFLDISTAQKELLAGDIGYSYMPDEITTKSAGNMKVPQYMARGVVPFVSNIGDLASYVDYGQSGYVCEPNHESLKDTLLKALNDGGRLRKANDAYASALNKFDWDKLAAKFDSWIGNDKKDYIKNSKPNKNVYFVATTVPGNTGGAEIRDLNLLRHWTDIDGVKVTAFFISTHGEENDKQNLKLINTSKNYLLSKPKRTIFGVIKSIILDNLPPFLNEFRISEIGNVFRNECEKNLPDIVYLSQIHTYYAISKHIPWLKNKGVKIILDAHNVEFRLFDESLDIFSFVKKIVGKRMVSKIKNMEIEATKASDVILCCSEIDKEFFIKYNPEVYVVPNGVDIKEFKVEKNIVNNSILFIGGIAYPPNEDAVRFYLTNIHPFVKRKIPDVKFLGVGVDKEWLSNNGFEDPTVSSLGFVPDIKEYLSIANVAICPIRYGSGTRLKILTYMAASLPVVSTYKGAEGVDYVNKRDILMEDEPEAFAGFIVELMKDKKFAEKIGQNGFDFASKYYDWEVIGKNLREIYKKI